ncbi:class I SAM-dependent methyltransferase [Phytohabitans sp. LJ34]|uniref:class I SAM-dependent methyltransferase n=1 Tax=Phytohabitans sp. LJ34 TaxID=3452217 RepID=UPI003F8C463D
MPDQHVPDTAGAVRRWWDNEADAYQAEHGEFLGDARFVWGPEGLDEADAHLLGEVAGKRILEIGCGAGQCGRWLLTQGAQVVGIDLAHGQLQHSLKLDVKTGLALPVAEADVLRLPFRDGSVDLACAAYGAMPFVADATGALREVARVLRPGGRFVFSTTHPFRWTFLDEPGEEGLMAVNSYFDRRPYLEYDRAGEPSYAEYHRTMGDWVRAVDAAGLRLAGLVEPEWPDHHDKTWGGWSRLRGKLFPGTAIFTCAKAA